MNESDRKLIIVSLLLAILFLSGDLVSAFVGMASPVSPVVPVPTTFIVQSVNNGASYNAYLSTSSTIPFFTETNFQTIMQIDILGSSFCLVGCSIGLLPGDYNQTATIQVKTNLVITGTPASIIFSQATFDTANFNVSSSSFTFQGPRIDDFARRFDHVTSCSIGSIIAQVPCHIPFVEYGSNCNINNVQIFNVTASGIYLTKLSSNCVVSFNTIFSISSQFTNASQSTGIGIVGSGSGHRISNNGVAYFHGGAGIQIGGGVINNALHSFAVENTLFHNEYGVQTNAAIDVHINDNTIYNSTSAGVFVTTGLIASTFGPLSVSGNNFGENGQGLCCGVLPGQGAHIILSGSRCCWYSVAIAGNVMLDRNATITEKTGIDITSSNYRNLTITGNSIGKTINPLTILLEVNPPDKSWVITANPGFNPQSKRTVTISSNPFTYTNNDAYMEQLIVDTVAGGLATMTCRGDPLPVPVIGTLSPVLNTLDTCVFTGTTTDTFDVLPLQG